MKSTERTAEVNPLSHLGASDLGKTCDWSVERGGARLRPRRGRDWARPRTRSALTD